MSLVRVTVRIREPGRAFVRRQRVMDGVIDADAAAIGRISMDSVNQR